MVSRAMSQCIIRGRPSRASWVENTTWILRIRTPLSFLNVAKVLNSRDNYKTYVHILTNRTILSLILLFRFIFACLLRKVNRDYNFLVLLLHATCRLNGSQEAGEELSQGDERSKVGGRFGA